MAYILWIRPFSKGPIWRYYTHGSKTEGPAFTYKDRLCLPMTQDKHMATPDADTQQISLAESSLHFRRQVVIKINP
jgi:hypothetical protein